MTPKKHETDDSANQEFAPYGLTILRVSSNLLATKRVVHTEGGPIFHGYDRAKNFVADPVTFEGLDDMYAMLEYLERDRQCCVIRAAPRPGANLARFRRLLRDDARTRDPATLMEVTRAWAAFDFDSIEAPVCLDPRDGEEAGQFLRDRLPGPFRDAACIVQATSGCGIKPGLRYRVWFILSRALLGAELEAWTAGSGADPSTLRPTEPIYTARPLFIGMPDPMPRRLWLLPGLEEAVQVPETLPAPAQWRAGQQAERASAGLGLVDDDDLAALAATIPNQDVDWHAWNKLGLAFFAASGGSEAGRAAWHAWSARSGKYDSIDADARWAAYRRSPPAHLTAGTLIHLARQADSTFELPSWRRMIEHGAMVREQLLRSFEAKKARAAA